MHPDVKKFWETQGFVIKTADEIYVTDLEWDADQSTNQLYYAWQDETHYQLIANISRSKSDYYFNWGKYSEAEMLKIVEEKV